jgi:hypothetical protein
MSNTITEIHVLELRMLLFDLKKNGKGVCIRFRMLGEMWQNHYSKVLNITETGAAFIEEPTNKLIFVQELNNVMQFEIDKPFQNYKPHFHYSITFS